MRTATVSEIKRELKHQSPEELTALVLRLAKFKKDNKELLTYLMFEAGDEQSYVDSVKVLMDEEFTKVNTKSYYFIKKSVRRILALVRKQIRYSPEKTTEVELLLYYCEKLAAMSPSYKRSTVLCNLYERLTAKLVADVAKLEPDLQYDYRLELEEKLGLELD